MHALAVPVVVLAAALAALPASAQSVDAKKYKDVLTGDAKGPASSNPLCKLFARAEVEAFLKAAVKPPENAAMGAGCSWERKDNDGMAVVAMAGARYDEPPSRMQGFKKLPAIGPKAWIAPDLGWRAGTVDGDRSISVNLSGDTASEAGAVAMLKATIERRPR